MHGMDKYLSIDILIFLYNNYNFILIILYLYII